MDAHFQLQAVAFVRGVGGVVRLVMVVERDGIDLFGGEPAVLVAHRPGTDPSLLEIELADRIEERAEAVLLRGAAAGLAALIDGAFTESGELDVERLVGQRVGLVAPWGLFDV